jgi:type IV pilus assembly protein PilW
MMTANRDRALHCARMTAPAGRRRGSALARALPGQSGFTLVELMVALTISLIILVAVASLFASSRSTQQTDEGLARLQENARFALDYLTREIRMAGYMGCLRIDKAEDLTNIHNNLNNSAQFPYDFRRPVEGFEANGTAPGATYLATGENPDPRGVAVTQWSPPLDASLQNRVIPGTDVIVVRRTSDAGMRLVPPFTQAAQLFIETGSDFRAGDILIVTDCAQASVFQATTVSDGSGRTNIAHGASGTPGNQCPNWGQPGCADPAPQFYTDGAEVARAATSTFFIGRGSAGIPALFVTVLQGGALAPREIVEGVENMQILYGLDMDAPPAPLDFPSRYMTANEVNALTAANPEAGWPRVMSVRISLLMRTMNISGQADQSPDTNTYNLEGTTVNPVDDRRRRRVFTTTIQLRNRLQG